MPTINRRDFLSTIGALSLNSVLLSGCGGGGSSDPTDSDKWYGLRRDTTIFAENQKQGSIDWFLKKAATDGQLQAYCTHSANKGQSIDVYASALAGFGNCSIDVFRLGWYKGDGARLIKSYQNISIPDQSALVATDNRGCTSCSWIKTLTIDTSSQEWADTPSGYFVVKISSSAGSQTYCYFVLRQDTATFDYLLVSSTATAHAYNSWGGRSLYDSDEDPTGSAIQTAAHAVSYQRPYSYAYKSFGAGNIFAWELKVLRFMERMGYSVGYTSDIDCDKMAPLNTNVVLLVGHSEYWTLQMRANFLKAQDAGINFFVAAANTGYWQIRLEDSTNGFKNIICYKLDQTEDPLAKAITASTNFYRLGLPEEDVIGVSYTGVLGSSVRKDLNLNLSKCPAWLLKNVTYDKSTQYLTLSAMLGYELDAITSKSPLNIVELSDDHVTSSSGTAIKSNVAYYIKNNGTKVFNTSTMSWSFGIDGIGYQPFGQVDSDLARQLTVNILDWLLQKN